MFCQHASGWNFGLKLAIRVTCAPLLLALAGCGPPRYETSIPEKYQPAVAAPAPEPAPAENSAETQPEALALNDLTRERVQKIALTGNRQFRIRQSALQRALPDAKLAVAGQRDLLHAFARKVVQRQGFGLRFGRVFSRRRFRRRGGYRRLVLLRNRRFVARRSTACQRQEQWRASHANREL